MTKHFTSRARERMGISEEEAVDLYHDLRTAAVNFDKWSDYVEPVKKLKNGVVAYRFRVRTGIFYAAMKRGFPLTILTQDMLRNKKFAIKMRAFGKTRGQP